MLCPYVRHTFLVSNSDMQFVLVYTKSYSSNHCSVNKEQRLWETHTQSSGAFLLIYYKHSSWQLIFLWYPKPGFLHCTEGQVWYRFLTNTSSPTPSFQFNVLIRVRRKQFSSRPPSIITHDFLRGGFHSLPQEDTYTVKIIFKYIFYKNLTFWN